MSSIPIVASVDDLPGAVRFAERKPSSRWYVMRRAVALGVGDQIPDTWGLQASITEAERKTAAKKGQAFNDGDYPIRNADELDAAIRTVGNSKDHNYDAVRRHIIKRARALGLTSQLPPDWGITAAGIGEEVGKVVHGLEGAWNDALHPRGRDGKFIEKGAKVHVFGNDSSSQASFIGTAVGNDHGMIQVHADAPGNFMGKTVKQGDTIGVEPSKIEAAPPAKAHLPGGPDDSGGAAATPALPSAETQGLTKAANDATLKASDSKSFEDHAAAAKAHTLASEAHAREGSVPRAAVYHSDMAAAHQTHAAALQPTPMGGGSDQAVADIFHDLHTVPQVPGGVHGEDWESMISDAQQAYDDAKADPSTDNIDNLGSSLSSLNLSDADQKTIMDAVGSPTIAQQSEATHAPTPDDQTIMDLRPQDESGNPIGPDEPTADELPSGIDTSPVGHLGNDNLSEFSQAVYGELDKYDVTASDDDIDSQINEAFNEDPKMDPNDVAANIAYNLGLEEKAGPPPGTDHPDLVSDWRPGELDPTDDREYGKAILSEARGYQEQNLDPEFADNDVEPQNDPQLDSLTNDLENALLAEDPSVADKADTLHSYLLDGYADPEDLPNRPEPITPADATPPELGDLPDNTPGDSDKLQPDAGSPDFPDGSGYAPSDPNHPSNQSDEQLTKNVKSGLSHLASGKANKSDKAAIQAHVDEASKRGLINTVTGETKAGPNTHTNAFTGEPTPNPGVRSRGDIRTMTSISAHDTGDGTPVTITDSSSGLSADVSPEAMKKIQPNFDASMIMGVKKGQDDGKPYVIASPTGAPSGTRTMYDPQTGEVHSYGGTSADLPGGPPHQPGISEHPGSPAHPSNATPHSKMLRAAAASHEAKTGDMTGQSDITDILSEPDHAKAHAKLAKFSTKAKHGGKQRARYRQALNEHRAATGQSTSPEHEKVAAKAPSVLGDQAHYPGEQAKNNALLPSNTAAEDKALAATHNGNPFGAHSQSVLDEFASGSHGPGPWTTGPGGKVWGTMEDAKAEQRSRRDKKNAARKAAKSAPAPEHSPEAVGIAAKYKAKSYATNRGLGDITDSKDLGGGKYEHTTSKGDKIVTQQQAGSNDHKVTGAPAVAKGTPLGTSHFTPEQLAEIDSKGKKLIAKTAPPAPAKAEQVPISSLKPGDYVKVPNGKDTAKTGLVGKPVDNGDGTVSHRYWDGVQWDYVTPDTKFEVQRRGAPTKKTAPPKNNPPITTKAPPVLGKKAAPSVPAPSSSVTKPKYVAHVPMVNNQEGHDKTYSSAVHELPGGKFAHTTAWGKTGAKPTTKTDIHDSRESALKAHNKTVDTRKKNGYFDAENENFHSEYAPGTGHSQEEHQALAGKPAALPTNVPQGYNDEMDQKAAQNIANAQKVAAKKAAAPAAPVSAGQTYTGPVRGIEVKPDLEGDIYVNSGGTGLIAEDGKGPRWEAMAYSSDPAVSPGWSRDKATVQPTADRAKGISGLVDAYQKSRGRNPETQPIRIATTLNPDGSLSVIDYDWDRPLGTVYPDDTFQMASPGVQASAMTTAAMRTQVLRRRVHSSPTKASPVAPKGRTGRG